MKSFLFVTLLAVALFAQVISVNGDVEFSTLINVVNQKAKDFNIEMPNLDFLVKITNDMNEAMATLNKPMSIFISDNKKRDVSYRFPNDFDIGNKTYHNLLNQIEEDNTKIEEHFSKISAQIQHKLPAAGYDESLERWQKNVNSSHINEVAKCVPMILPPFINYNHVFNLYVKSTVTLRKKIDEIIAAAGELYEELSNSTKAKKQRKLINKIIKKMEEFIELQKKFEFRLDNIEEILSFYNNSRTNWSDFILARTAQYIQFGKFPAFRIPPSEE